MKQIVFGVFLVLLLSGFSSAATQLTHSTSQAGDISLVTAVNGIYAYHYVTAIDGNGTSVLHYYSSTGTDVSTSTSVPAFMCDLSATRSTLSTADYVEAAGISGTSSTDTSRTFDTSSLTWGSVFTSSTAGGASGTCSSAKYGAVSLFDSQRRADIFTTWRTTANVAVYKRVYTNNNTLLCTIVGGGTGPGTMLPSDAKQLNATGQVLINNNGVFQTLGISNSSTCTYPSAWDIANVTTFSGSPFSGALRYQIYFSQAGSTHTLYNTNVLFSSSSAGNQELYWTNVSNPTVATRLTTTAADESLMSAYQNEFGTVYFIYSNGTNYFLESLCGYDTTPSIGGVCAGESTNFNFTQAQPNLLMKIIDKARCVSGCQGFSLTNEDWVEITLLSNNTVVESASCTGTSFGGLPFTFTFENSNNPFGTADVYSANLNTAANDFVDVQCSFNSTKIIGQFYVQETRNDLSGWDVKAGKGTHFDDRISVYEAPANVRIIQIQEDTPAPICYYINSALGTSNGPYNPTQSQDLGDTIKFTYLITDDPLAIQSTTYSAGFKKYEVFCGDTRGVPDLGRMASVSEARYMQVLDACGGSYQTSRIRNKAVPVSGYYNDTFFYRQRPNYDLVYEYYYQNQSTWKENVCVGTYQLTYGNGTLMYRRNIPRGFHPDWFDLMTEDHDTGEFLPVGNYTFTVQCDNSDPNICVLPATFNKTITIIAGAGCSGNVASCGTTSCSVCQPISLTCEDGSNVTVPAVCDNQICYNQTQFLEDNEYQLPDGCFIYKNEVEIEGGRYTDVVCQPNTDMQWFTYIKKGNQRVDPRTINAFCTFDVYTWSSVNQNQTKLLSGTSVMDSLNRRFNSLIPNYATTLGCDRYLEFRATCSADEFLTEKVAFQVFNIAPNEACSDGTQAGTCVFSRTGNPLDNPMYCDNDLTLVNNSAFCGCAPGQERQNATNGCTGSPFEQPKKNDLQAALYWLFKPSNLWWIPLFIVIVLAFGAYTRNTVQKAD